MCKLKLQQLVAVIIAVFAALAFMSFPSAALAATSWSPEKMAEEIAAGTGVDVVESDDDSETINSGSDDVVADDESDVVTSASSTQAPVIGDIMNSSVAMMIGSIIIGGILSVIGIITILLFIVLCGTLINRIRCTCEHPSQARMYEKYTNKLILALGLTMLCEFIIVVIYLVALM